MLRLAAVHTHLAVVYKTETVIVRLSAAWYQCWQQGKLFYRQTGATSHMSQHNSHIYIYIYIYICTYKNIHTHMYTYMYLYVSQHNTHKYIYIFIYIYMQHKAWAPFVCLLLHLYCIITALANRFYTVVVQCLLVIFCINCMLAFALTFRSVHTCSDSKRKCIKRTPA